jgi:hypothetical protein
VGSVPSADFSGFSLEETGMAEADTSTKLPVRNHVYQFHMPLHSPLVGRCLMVPPLSFGQSKKQEYLSAVVGNRIRLEVTILPMSARLQHARKTLTKTG